VKAGEKLSLQYHKKKAETMFLISGMANLQVGDIVRGLYSLNPVYISPYTIHRLEAVSDALVLEVSSTELNDVIRLEDFYGRC